MTKSTGLLAGLGLFLSCRTAFVIAWFRSGRISASADRLRPGTKERFTKAEFQKFARDYLGAAVIF